MPKPRTGNAFESRGKWYARTPIGKGKRHCSPMPWCEAGDDAAATARARLLCDLATALGTAPDGAVEIAPRILDRAAAATDPAELRRVRELVARVAGGQVTAKRNPLTGSTFGEVATAWTSGDLAKRYPDHVKAKKKKTSGNDEQRLRDFVTPIIGGVPMHAFRIEHAEQVMAALPAMAPATRRHVAQTIGRVVAMAVYPLRLLAANPIPRGWLPRVPKGAQKKQEVTYPQEHDALLACNRVPLEDRLYAGFIAREGMRHDEADRLTWGDLDLERGLVRLDVNKTDDPRSWDLRPGTARALRRWHALLGKPGRSGSVFVQPSTGSPVRLRPDVYRGHLLAAGVDRHELHHGTKVTGPTGIHGLRGLFVTESCSRGETERWIIRRTGHKSSDMVTRYEDRAASWGAEAKLGDLDVALRWERAAVPEEQDPPVVKRASRARKPREKAGSRRVATSRVLLKSAAHLGVPVRPRAEPPTVKQGETRRDEFASEPQQTEALPIPLPFARVASDPLDATIATLGAALGAAAAAGDVATIASLSATISKLTDELRARRLDSAGVVDLETKRGAR